MAGVPAPPAALRAVSAYVQQDDVLLVRGAASVLVRVTPVPVAFRNHCFPLICCPLLRCVACSLASIGSAASSGSRSHDSVLGRLAQSFSVLFHAQGTLTPRESVEFSSQLRLPASMSAE